MIKGKLDDYQKNIVNIFKKRVINVKVQVWYDLIN